MDAFSLLLDLVIALGAALTLGLVLARLRQSAIVGFLLAGVLIGPHGLALVRAVSEVRAIAELGVALLLFTIGLELPWRRLRSIGVRGAGAGVLQIILTAAATLLVCLALGLSMAQSAVLGMVVALSSTAVVFRVLADRAEIDSVPGRVTAGVLLVQDMAAVPFLLLVPLLAGAGEGNSALWELSGTLVRGVFLIAALFIVARTLVSALFSSAAAARNRELFIILALTFCLGATVCAHTLGLSPVLGAFIAGVALADSKFAAQVRAEIGSLRVGFLALFFVSIGMLVDLSWLVPNAPAVAGVILAVVIGKTLLASLVVRSLAFTERTAVIAGLSLAHIGELSFVVAALGLNHQIISANMFELVVSASVITRLLAPYLIGSAGWLATLLPGGWAAGTVPVTGKEGASKQERLGHVIVVGYGPTGRRVVSALKDVGTPHLVLELNPRTVDEARARGMDIEYGDASQAVILQHASLPTALALVVTVPDPATTTAIVGAAKAIRPDIPVVARARYAQYARLIAESGADALVNEEEMMGERLAAVTLRCVGLASEGMARVGFR